MNEGVRRYLVMREGGTFTILGELTSSQNDVWLPLEDMAKLLDVADVYTMTAPELMATREGARSLAEWEFETGSGVITLMWQHRPADEPASTPLLFARAARARSKASDLFVRCVKVWTHSADLLGQNRAIRAQKSEDDRYRRAPSSASISA
jgi:hypothetical protein